MVKSLSVPLTSVSALCGGACGIRKAIAGKGMAGSGKGKAPLMGTPKIEKLPYAAIQFQGLTSPGVFYNTNPVNNTFEFIWSGALNPKKATSRGGFLYGTRYAPSGKTQFRSAPFVTLKTTY